MSPAELPPHCEPLLFCLPTVVSWIQIPLPRVIDTPGEHESAWPSIAHALSQPSPEETFPSSQTSPVSRAPLPQGPPPPVPLPPAPPPLEALLDELALLEAALLELAVEDPLWAFVPPGPTPAPPAPPIPDELDPNEPVCPVERSFALN